METTLRMHFKAMGRSYIYEGQDLTNSPWYLLDEDGTRYEDQNEYREVQAKKKAAAKKTTAKKKAVVKKVED